MAFLIAVKNAEPSVAIKQNLACAPVRHSSVGSARSADQLPRRRDSKMARNNLESIHATIESVALSPVLKSYNVGVTINSERRRKQYINFDPMWPHYVILRSGLSCSAANALEKSLHAKMQSNKESLVYLKYRKDTRDGKYTPSLGGLSKDNDHPYDLYMAWGNFDDN